MRSEIFSIKLTISLVLIRVDIVMDKDGVVRNIRKFGYMTRKIICVKFAIDAVLLSDRILYRKLPVFFHVLNIPV